MKSAKWLGLLALATLAPRLAYPAAWDVIRLRDRDYVSFANVAEFYRFREYSHARRQITLQGDRCGLRAQVGTSELYINGARFFTHFPLLERGDTQLISAFDVGKIIEPVLRPSRIRNINNQVDTVVLDPGHGGSDHGTANHWGSEKNFALAVALIARTQLQKAGFKVEMTRGDDTARSLEERIDFANQFPRAVFVSIHFNSGSGIGVESYALAPIGAASNVSSGEHHASGTDASNSEGNAQDSQNIALAAAVHAAVLSRAGAYDRGIKHARFKVLRDIRIPALLLEAGFLDDKAEGQRVATAQYQQQLGTAIAQGVASYNTAINYQSPKPPIAVVRSDFPPADRARTQPLPHAADDERTATAEPSLSINGGE
ncbi:MAG TPA: N-acetylmuramoyl-L-alanine amidase [Chthoniobacterales bacterium]|nr:N-acetylmuramoyl-L-alanine amidase [Chthoniobacterales bacterium]